ncbi:hypothetical protein BLOT_000263 [Blomia tropicalis]|nr:hypothetical protein BLOT_000263 [Blomia tropicalis]
MTHFFLRIKSYEIANGIILEYCTWPKNRIQSRASIKIRMVWYTILRFRKSPKRFFLTNENSLYSLSSN